MIISDVRITPVAIPDVPILNTKGVHGAVYLRAIIEVETNTGLVGLGETYGAKRTLEGLRTAAKELHGLNPLHLHELRARIERALPHGGGVNAPTALADHKVVDVVYSAFEVACLDIQGKAFGLRFCDLLGGAVREEIPFGGYLFYKFAKPQEQVGEDMFGEVMSPEALVEEAAQFVQDHGFRSLKLKGGVLEPDAEIETMLRLRERFPDHPLRIDPMGAWVVPTAKRVSDALSGVLEYLEDPVTGMQAMSELSAQIDIPLATNLVVVEFDQIFESYAKNAVQIVLSDHHYWRGARGALTLGEFCRAAGMGVSMHSNSHLGISLAAMCHVAAATPNLTYDCDTHFAWTRHDVVEGGKRQFVDGILTVPEGPGLGVALDRDAVGELHDLYLSQASIDRDDTMEIRKYIPDYERKVPRW